MNNRLIDNYIKFEYSALLCQEADTFSKWSEAK